ncbi:MAG: hypothetical protein Q9162_004885 [Coniocarpon cinnabarinum]
MFPAPQPAMLARDHTDGFVSSFGTEFRRRPPGYRTPSPPRHAIEPLTPTQTSFDKHTTTTQETASKKRSHDAMRAYGVDGAGDWSFQNTKSFGWNSNRAAQPSPAFIDTRKAAQSDSTALEFLATVATSPSLASRGPQALGPYPPSTKTSAAEHHFSKPQPFERASKRSRSEVLSQRPNFSNDSRPSTSYVYPSAFRPSSSYSTMPVYEQSVPATLPTYNPPSQQSQKHVEDDVREDAELLLSISRGVASATDRHSWEAKESTTPYGHPGGPRGALESRSLNGLINDAPLEYESNAHPTPIGLHHKNLVVTNLKTQPLPGEAGAMSASKGAHSSVHVSEHIVSVKPKDHRGWPKGKPRGPKTTGQENKRAKTKSAKRTEGQSQASNPNSRSRGKTQQRQPSDSVRSWDAVLSVPADVRRPRRNTESPAKGRDSNLIVEEHVRNPRRSSAPPNMSLVREGLARAGGKRKAARRDQPTDTCKACKQDRNAAGGLHELWINCNGCKSWFHIQCAGFEDEKKVKEVDKYYCDECEPQHGSTTFVRKSSRAHASVDYAGLHEGKVRSAVDVPDHHYIEPIKTGALEFQPETFARLPPELVTREYLERCGGWTEPILIPAAFNPRPAENTTPAVDMRDDALRTDNEKCDFVEDYEYDCVVDDGQDDLDMVIPRGLTVRRVAELYGPEEKVDVIDVKLQEGEDRRWSMRQWADYYEAEGAKPVRNVISLEVSQSILGKLIRRPKVVRDLDLQDSIWPEEEIAKGVFPRVQFYCLMSVADCYTDFHIDFGGSSVYYHILKGRKTFFFIPPKPKYLKKYEEWCNSPDQNSVFLGDETKECYRVDLYPGDTMLIPSGWIHAVWTPENSLVIGGNFLTRMHYGTQIAVNEIEKATNVTRKFRYPHFQKILWLAVVQYLEQDPIPSTVVDLLCGGRQFEREQPIYHDSSGDEEDVEESGSQPELHNARFYSQAELDGLPDLIRYIYRTVMISLGKLPGISRSTQEAVIKSMPKNCDDHLETLRTFAMWTAWKRGNENIPVWAYPDAPLADIDPTAAEKKAGAAAQKKLERRAMQEAAGASGRRASLRSPQAAGQANSMTTATSPVTETAKSSKSIDSRRMACDACRKSKRRCTHNVAAEDSRPAPAPAPAPVPAPAPTSAGRFGVKIVRPPNLEEAETLPAMKQEPGVEPSLASSTELLAQSVPVTVPPAAQMYSGPLLMNPYEPSIPPMARVATTEPPKSLPPVRSTNGSTQRQPKNRACEACRRSKVSERLMERILDCKLTALKHRCTHNGNASANGPATTSNGAKRAQADSGLEHAVAKKVKKDSDPGSDNIGATRESNEPSVPPKPVWPVQPEQRDHHPDMVSAPPADDPTQSEANAYLSPPLDQKPPATSHQPSPKISTTARVPLNGIAAASPYQYAAALANTAPPLAPLNIQSAADQPKVDVSDHPTTFTSGIDSRSRTSSIHVQTTSTSDAQASHSPPTSPLTEPEPSSPVHSTVLIPPITPASSSRRTPTSARRRSSTVSNGRAHSVRKPSEARRGSSGSAGKAGSPPREKTQRELEEEESMALAKSLMAAEAGLRRRGVVRYSR